MSNDLVIYKLTSPSGKSYIGQTRNFRMRCNEHKSSKHCTKLSSAIKKYGLESFSHEILESGLTIEQANIAEELYINEHATIHPNGYNLASGGGASRHNDETKKLISSIQKGRVKSEDERKKISESNKGKKLSDAHKEKLRVANVGKKMSQESIAKTVAANTGRKHSEETRAKLSESHKGHTASEETKLKMSASRKGKKQPIEAIRKSSESRKGQKRSEETKERMRIAYAKRREAKNG
jgi:group I intron endonuclease